MSATSLSCENQNDEIEIANLRKQETLQQNDCTRSKLRYDILVLNVPAAILISKRPPLDLIKAARAKTRPRHRHTERMVVQNEMVITMGGETMAQIESDQANAISFWSYTHAAIKREQSWQPLARHTCIIGKAHAPSHHG